MPIEPGTRLGPYEILSPLGAGGMGEVYRAKDTRLGREVAIKVLPLHLSDQPEVRARFEREAKTISSLNHPNICALYDVGKEGDVDFLVLELVDGETLEARLVRGRVPAPEAMRLATQIADALDRAHRAGVIHRDLKPSNVMLTRSGAKLMDFGLARATGMVGPAGISGATMGMLTQSPSVARGLTAEGTLLGTFQYMSPEQLEGKEADARSDVWALGCVLYELFTGRRAFEGRSQASLIAAILEREPAPVGEPASGAPPPSASVAGLTPPAGIDRLIRNCLAKDPEERIQTAHDVRLQLQGIAEGAGLSTSTIGTASAVAAAATAGVSAARPATPGRAGVGWLAAAFCFALAVGLFAWLWPAAHATRPVLRFRLTSVPGAVQVFWPRVSPDGKYLLVEYADSTGQSFVGVRPLDQLEPRPIPGTDGVSRAYWGPDSKEIVLVLNGKLERVSLAGGSPIVICDAPNGSDLSWSSRGMILMDGAATDSLVMVPAGGGQLRPATNIDRKAGETGSSWPCFLPDGEHFLCIGNLPGSSAGDIRLGRIGTLETKLLGKSDGRVEYAPGGWVLFVQGSLLMAQQLDLGAAKLTGQPIQITDRLRIGGASGHFSTSQSGVLAFARDEGGGSVNLQAMSRAGVLDAKSLLAGELSTPMLSPDGRRLLYMRVASAVAGIGEVYVFDLDRGTDTRLTFTGSKAGTPVWSPDGRRFAYSVRSSPNGGVFRIGSADGLGAPDSIVAPKLNNAWLSEWSAVGSRLVAWANPGVGYSFATEGTDRNPAAMVDTTNFIVQERISPDGKWLAATSGAPPNVQVYVFSLGGSPGRWQISTAPAFRPHWTKGGHELVFEGFDSGVWAVDIDDKDGFHAGMPHRLFTLPSVSPSGSQTSWDCDPTGEHFYVLAPSRTATAGNIEIVSDFHSLVSRK